MVAAAVDLLGCRAALPAGKGEAVSCDTARVEGFLERQYGRFQDVATKASFRLLQPLNFERNGHFRVGRDLGLPEDSCLE